MMMMSSSSAKVRTLITWNNVVKLGCIKKTKLSEFQNDETAWLPYFCGWTHKPRHETSYQLPFWIEIRLTFGNFSSCEWHVFWQFQHQQNINLICLCTKHSSLMHSTDCKCLLTFLFLMPSHLIDNWLKMLMGLWLVIVIDKATYTARNFWECLERLKIMLYLWWKYIKF